MYRQTNNHPLLYRFPCEKASPCKNKHIPVQLNMILPLDGPALPGLASTGATVGERQRARGGERDATLAALTRAAQAVLARTGGPGADLSGRQQRMLPKSAEDGRHRRHRRGGAGGFACRGVQCAGGGGVVWYSAPGAAWSGARLGTGLPTGTRGEYLQAAATQAAAITLPFCFSILQLTSAAAGAAARLQTARLMMHAPLAALQRHVSRRA